MTSLNYKRINQNGFVITLESMIRNLDQWENQLIIIIIILRGRWFIAKIRGGKEGFQFGFW